MSNPPPKSKAPKLSSAEAQARLADALRDNLRRRKTQLRAREEGRQPEAERDKSGGKTK